MPLSVPCGFCPHFLPAGALSGDGGVTGWKEAGSLGCPRGAKHFCPYTTDWLGQFYKRKANSRLSEPLKKIKVCFILC